MRKDVDEIRDPRLSLFTRGYLDCLGWLGAIGPDDRADVDADHFDPDVLDDQDFNRCVDECAQFYQHARSQLEQVCKPLSDYDWEKAGHDFCLTRNGHGAGFWDRGREKVWTELTDMSKTYGEMCGLIGDDGSIFLS